MKTIAFAYGWSEGPWHIREYKRLLEEQGYKVINEIKSAHVIIAHSLGCFMLPKDFAAQTIVLIGVPFWPQRGVVNSLFLNIKRELGNKRGFTWWFKRSFFAFVYAVKGIVYTIRALVRRRKHFLPTVLPNKNYILVLNRDDDFSHPQIQKLLPMLSEYTLIDLSGGHEDWRINPKPYVALLLRDPVLV